MAKLTRHSGGGIIFITFIIALFLTVIPLPDWAALLRPEWAALFLIYWAIALPHRVGVGIGWILGIFVDILRGAVFGQHAFALLIIAYLALKLHQRIRVYPLWQQSLSILVLVTLYQLLLLWINGVIGKPASSWTYWLPAFSSMLMWPAVYVVLRSLRRGFGVS
jgi:rod shape-determining protein MreD